MGLDTTHNCWHGAYSAFSRFRNAIAEIAGIPLPLMDGFYSSFPVAESNLTPLDKEAAERLKRYLPIKWETLRFDPATFLLNHSDCEGIIEDSKCRWLAIRLEEIAEMITPEHVERYGGGHLHDLKAQVLQFAKGCSDAYNAGENVEFH